MRWLSLLIAVPLLASCASQTAQRDIPLSQYRTVAAYATKLVACGGLGHASEALMEEGARYVVNNAIESGYNRAVLTSSINEAIARTGIETKDFQRIRQGTDLTEQDRALVHSYQSKCHGIASAVLQERQRRQIVARNRQQALSNMASTLSQMGQSMRQAGSNAFQATQPPPSSTQPSFGLPSNNWNHSLMNDPGGLRQRHCTQTSSNTQYCF